MKKPNLSIVAIAIVLLAVAQAKAVPITVDIVAGYNGNPVLTGGGEFNVSGLGTAGYAASDIYQNGAGNLGFGTFCIATSLDLLNPPNDFNNPFPYNAVVDPTGINPATSAQITVGTAWLYYEFATGALVATSTLAGYNYTPGSQPGVPMGIHPHWVSRRVAACNLVPGRPDTDRTGGPFFR